MFDIELAVLTALAVLRLGKYALYFLELLVFVIVLVGLLHPFERRH